MNTVKVAMVGRLKNNALYRALESYKTQKKLAQALGVGINTLSAWILLKVVPSKAWILKNEERIVRVLGELPEDVWPEAFREKAFREADKKFGKTVDVPEDSFLSLSQCRALPSPEVNAEERLDQEKISALINDALLGLVDRPKRAAEVVRLRFGLADEEPLTYEEIGTRYEITRSRAMQTVGKALMEIRNKLPALIAKRRRGATLTEKEEQALRACVGLKAFVSGKHEELPPKLTVAAPPAPRKTHYVYTECEGSGQDIDITKEEDYPWDSVQYKYAPCPICRQYCAVYRGTRRMASHGSEEECVE